MSLTEEHISYIIKDLNHRGILLNGFQEEVIDHVCSSVEAEMKNGIKFMDAYEKIISSFGNTEGLAEIQNETIQSRNSIFLPMLKNYLTIAFRNLNKYRFYTGINVFGLAVGVAASLIITLYVIHELSYDRYNEKADRIYRVDSEIKYGGSHWVLALGPAPLAGAMLNDFPEIEAAVRFRSHSSYLIKTTDVGTNIKEEKVIWTDNSFFDIFSVPVISGNAKTALSDANSVAISRHIAEKYYPGEDALGKSLILDNVYHCKITAVYENIPDASHFHFDIMAALVGDTPPVRESKSDNFLSNNFNTYVLLRKDADPKNLDAKIPAFINKYMGPQAAAAFGGEFDVEKFRASGNKLDYYLSPLTNIHLHSDRTGELEPNGDITYIYLFSAIALFIMMIASINFMNLSTARSANRGKEVGIRKVMGSLRSHLVRQFLTESVLLSIFSFIIALGIAYLFLPAFNSALNKQLFIPYGSGVFYVILFLAALVIGVFAGLYPSFFLSAFKPVNVLKGNMALGMKSGAIRSSLVVFQFVISIFLIIGTITVYRQLNYIQNKKIGFNKEQVIIVHDGYALRHGRKNNATTFNTIRTFKSEVLKNSSIKQGTISGFLPVTGGDHNSNSFWAGRGKPDSETMVALNCWAVDYDYAKTLGMNIKAGRDFSEEFISDSSGVILNEAAVKQFNLIDPIGKEISTFKDIDNPNSFESWTVIGVVEDFHYESLKQNISPVAFFPDRSDGAVMFRFEAKNTADVIQSIEKVWKEMAPGEPFNYSFLDEDFGRMYSTEQRVGELFTTFSGLAILIACLGLFALTAFTAEQRTKEIGVRKVLGASVSSIVLLLSKEFGKLILIAFVLAAPIAWYGVDLWLSNYSYKTEIGIFVYMIAGLITFAIAWLTMSFQSLKAARNNPVKSLRSE